jgi:hypothetical protein
MVRACSARGSDENTYRSSVGNLKRRDHLEDLGVDGRILFECVLF